MSIKSKIQSLIDSANAKTGETDTTLTEAVQTLVDGYGQSGSGGNYNIESVDDGNGGQILNITDAGGSSSDITTPWVALKRQEVVIGANDVTQPVQVVAYFEGIVGQGNVCQIFLAESKPTYINNELLVWSSKGIGSGASASSMLGYRMRGGMVNSFGFTSGYDLRLAEGSKYIIEYYTKKP